MGMAASQARFLQLTSRFNDIGYEQTRLSNEKVSLARDMQRISRNYQTSLSKKVLKWTNNSGVSYMDLSYNNLMTPSAMNQYKPYMLTNLEGRIVIDSRYEEYAKMISPDGKPRGDYDSHRNAIIEDLLNIDMGTYNDLNLNLAEAQSVKDDAQKALDEHLVQKPKLTMSSNFDSLWRGYNCGSTNLYQCTVDKQYSNKASYGDYPKFLEEFLKMETEDAKKIAEAFGLDINNPDDKDYTLFKEAVKSTIEQIKQNPDLYKDGDKKEGWNVTDCLGKLKGHLKISFPNLVNENGEFSYYSNPKEFEKYRDWAIEHEELTEALNQAKSVYNTALSATNMNANAETEKLIKFYDDLFNTIAEKGWECNSMLKDNDYVNQMLQNNMYTITTAEKVVNCDYGEKKEGYEFDTAIASNFSYIASVNDTDAANDALVQYEYEKSIVNSKETRIDNRLNDLQTEQSAIKKMLDGLKSVISDNSNIAFKTMG